MPSIVNAWLLMLGVAGSCLLSAKSYAADVARSGTQFAGDSEIPDAPVYVSPTADGGSSGHRSQLDSRAPTADFRDQRSYPAAPLDDRASEASWGVSERTRPASTANGTHGAPASAPAPAAAKTQRDVFRDPASTPGTIDPFAPKAQWGDQNNRAAGQGSAPPAAPAANTAGFGQPSGTRRTEARTASYNEPSEPLEASAPKASHPAPIAGGTLSGGEHEKTLPLAPPKTATGRATMHKELADMPALIGSLAIVLGLFFMVVVLLRRGMPKGLTVLPREAVEVLGRIPLAGRHYMHLVRCGNKVLLVSVTPAGAETLAEITDPAEVDRLDGLCRQGRSHRSMSAFQQAFQQFDDRRGSGEFYADERDQLDFGQLGAVAGRARHREASDV